jgi:hypothetical protein
MRGVFSSVATGIGSQRLIGYFDMARGNGCNSRGEHGRGGDNLALEAHDAVVQRRDISRISAAQGMSV